MRHYGIRLIDMDAPDGEIDTDDLVAIVAAMKRLTRRLTREVLEQPGQGRPSGMVESLSRSRVAMGTGSTTLAFTVGDPAALEIDPIAEAVDARFRELVSDFESEDGPQNASESILGAAAELARAVTAAAPVAEFSTGDESSTIPVRRSEVHLDRWVGRIPAPEVMRSLTGRLEMGDLHSSAFRIRDAVGNTVDLVDVPEPETVIPFLGMNVTVTGLLTPAVGATKNRMRAPEITLAVGVLERFGLAELPSMETLREQARSAPEPQPLDLTDDEIDSFMAAIRE